VPANNALSHTNTLFATPLRDPLRLFGRTSTADRRGGDDWTVSTRTKGAEMNPSTGRRHAAYYRADVQGLNADDPATRTLDPLDGKEYTYATTRLDVARAIAARHADFRVYRVTLEEPIEADPDAAQDNLGEFFVRSPWGTVADVVGEKDE
jgi:hypothetical protein